MALADLEVVEVVGWCNLDCAGAFFRIGIVVADDRDDTADQRQHDVAADQVLELLVLRMNGDGGVAQHGLGPRGGDDDIGRTIVRIEALTLDRVAQMPEAALDLDLLDLEVGNRSEQLRVPVDQPLVLVDQAGAVQFDKHLGDRARQALVHGEPLARPVAGGP